MVLKMMLSDVAIDRRGLCHHKLAVVLRVGLVGLDDLVQLLLQRGKVLSRPTDLQEQEDKHKGLDWSREVPDTWASH